MRILVLGATRQLGRELIASLPTAQRIALARDAPDLRDPRAVMARLCAERPDVVINTAADNRVDAAETDPAAAHAINADAVEHLARATRAAGAFLVHTSTDYVFDGRARRPYAEDDVPHPLGAYGRSKLAGEARCRDLAPSHAVVRVAGLYATGGSRGEFARATLVAAGIEAAVTRVTSATHAARAPRPAYSVLANTRLVALGEPPLRRWRDALVAYVAAGESVEAAR